MGFAFGSIKTFEIFGSILTNEADFGIPCFAMFRAEFKDTPDVDGIEADETDINDELETVEIFF